MIRITRGILLKGNGPHAILPNVWPIALFAVVAGIAAMLSFRETLDQASTALPSPAPRPTMPYPA